MSGRQESCCKSAFKLHPGATRLFLAQHTLKVQRYSSDVVLFQFLIQSDPHFTTPLPVSKAPFIIGIG